MKNSKIVNLLKKRSPEILMGLGIAGFCTAVVTAVTATPKAIDILKEEEAKLPEGETLTPAEKVKYTWKEYAPTAALCVGSTICILESNKKLNARNAMATAGWKLAETALDDYKESTRRLVSEDKLKEIDEDVAKKQVKRNPDVPRTKTIIGGQSLFYEPLSKQYFYSRQQTIMDVINHMNNTMMNLGAGNYTSFNEVLLALGLDEDDMLGDDMGWNSDHGLIECTITGSIAENGEPCGVLNWGNGPRVDYSELGWH